MELLSHLALGFSVALSMDNLLYCLLGTLLGTLIGVLPGVGPLSTMAVLLPLTYNLSPTASLIMLSGIYYGAQYGGSTTAILVNLPGEASSAVTAIDGYQMARKGRAGPALAAAAIGSFVAGTIGTFIIALFAVPLTEFALKFGPAEYFSLMIVGLVSSIALGTGPMFKAISMILLGLLLGTIGTDMYSGEDRFTYGLPELADGINFVALSAGIFGIAEILRNLDRDDHQSVVVSSFSRAYLSLVDLRRIVMPTLRGSVIGSALGILPGGGPLLSSFAAYTLEKKISRNSAEFGHGAIEGVAAPESANNAGAQTSFIPMLALGIPAGPSMAIMIAAMIVQGVVPGPNVATSNPDLFWGIIASMWVGNLMLVVLNLPLIGIWVRLLSVPYWALFPVIVTLSCIGVYSVSGISFDVLQISAFTVIGYFLMRLGCEPAPLILGFVLGPMIEEYFRRAMIISHGDPLVFVSSPGSAFLLSVAALILIAICAPSLRKKREEIFVE